jgi:hypothetical protein
VQLFDLLNFVAIEPEANDVEVRCHVLQIRGAR